MCTRSNFFKFKLHYLLDTGLKQVSQPFHQLGEGGPLLWLPLPAVQHGLISTDKEYTVEHKLKDRHKQAFSMLDGHPQRCYRCNGFSPFLVWGPARANSLARVSDKLSGSVPIWADTAISSEFPQQWTIKNHGSLNNTWQHVDDWGWLLMNPYSFVVAAKTPFSPQISFFVGKKILWLTFGLIFSDSQFWELRKADGPMLTPPPPTIPLHLGLCAGH